MSQSGLTLRKSNYNSSPIKAHNEEIGEVYKNAALTEAIRHSNDHFLRFNGGGRLCLFDPDLHVIPQIVKPVPMAATLRKKDLGIVESRWHYLEEQSKMLWRSLEADLKAEQARQVKKGWVVVEWRGKRTEQEPNYDKLTSMKKAKLQSD